MGDENDVPSLSPPGIIFNFPTSDDQEGPAPERAPSEDQDVPSEIPEPAPAVRRARGRPPKTAEQKERDEAERTARKTAAFNRIAAESLAKLGGWETPGRWEFLKDVQEALRRDIADGRKAAEFNTREFTEAKIWMEIRNSINTRPWSLQVIEDWDYCGTCNRHESGCCENYVSKKAFVVKNLHIPTSAPVPEPSQP